MKIGMSLGLYFGDHVGGAEVQTSYLVSHSLRFGHEVSLVHFGKENSEGPVEESGGFSRYQVRLPWRDIKSTSYLNRRSIFRTLDMMSPDVLYQRGDFHFSDLVSSWGHRRKVPVVSAVSMERHCHPDRVRLNHMLPFSLADRFLKRRYYRWSDLILTQTEHQRRMLKERMGFDSVVVPNGHPVPRGPFPKEEPPLISWVANIKPIKRPFEFLEVCRAFEGEDVRFVMAGRRDTASYQTELDASLERMRNVEYLGEVKPDRANEIIGRSTLFVNTSESEGFSNTYIQAWMRETPVITLSADPDGILEREGIGKRTDTVENMISVIRSLLGDTARLRDMGARAREYAKKEHDIDVIGNRHLELFRKLVSEKEV